MVAFPHDFIVEPAEFTLGPGAAQTLDITQDIETDGQPEQVTIIYRFSAWNDLYFVLDGGQMVKGVRLVENAGAYSTVEAPPSDQLVPPGIRVPVALRHQLRVKKGTGEEKAFYWLFQRFIDAGARLTRGRSMLKVESS